MWNFISKARESKQKKTASDIGRYSELIRKGVASDKLSSQEQSELERLADSLGKSVETLEADAAAIREAGELEKTIAGMDTAKKTWKAAETAAAEYGKANNLEELRYAFEKKLKEIDAEYLRLSRVTASAEQKISDLCKAETRLAEIRNAAWRVLGLSEQPKKYAVEFVGYSNEFRKKFPQGDDSSERWPAATQDDELAAGLSDELDESLELSRQPDESPVES